VTTDTTPIFINGSTVMARAGSSLGAVLADHDPDLLKALLDGSGEVTDARGLPVDPDAPVYGGAIYRVFKRARRGETADA
jgi:hypothetical protein